MLDVRAFKIPRGIVMKKIFLTIAIMCVLVSDCFAMQFNNLQKIGEFSQGGKSGGYTAVGLTNFSCKREGVAIFGNNHGKLYIHFGNGNFFKVGSESILNTVDTRLAYTTIYQITTDSDLVLYAIEECEPTGDYTIVGQRADGKFVKFISTEDIKLQYFGRIYGTYQLAHIKVLGDKIVIPFGKEWRYPIGEFVFKWDESAQWFSIEKVVY